MAAILIVEDEEKIARFVELELQHEGCLLYTSCLADRRRCMLLVKRISTAAGIMYPVCLHLPMDSV